MVFDALEQLGFPCMWTETFRPIRFYLCVNPLSTNIHAYDSEVLIDKCMEKVYINGMHVSIKHNLTTTPVCVDSFKGCWYLCEGGKVLRELPPHFFHHRKEVQKNTLPSFNTIIIPGERTHLAFAPRNL